MEAAWRSLS